MTGHPPPSFRQLSLYFLRLGAVGFGGPVALANSMRKDLVEQGHWLTEPEYDDGLAIAGAASGMSGKLFLFFFRTGLLVFGSGLVIVPFLKSYVVDRYHWLGNREFLDSVAIGMISPGPVVITATFVGYLLAGLPGALAAPILQPGWVLG